MEESVTRNSHGCVLCGLAARMAARTRASGLSFVACQSCHGSNAAPFPTLKTPCSIARQTPPPMTRTVIAPALFKNHLRCKAASRIKKMSQGRLKCLTRPALQIYQRSLPQVAPDFFGGGRHELAA